MSPLPDGWKYESVKLISTVINGYAFKSKDFSEQNEVKSIKITNVGVRQFVPNSSSLLPSGFEDKYKKVQVPAGSIVIALTRSIISNGLKVALVPKKYGGALLNQRVACVVANKEQVLPLYLYHFLCSDEVVGYVKKQANTLMQPNLSITDLKNLIVPIPPLTEQKRIVAILDEALSGIDKAMANAEKNLANARELFESYLNDVFSQKGEGWEAKKLAELGQITSSKRIFKREYSDTGIPFYRTKEIKEKANNRSITTELYISEERYSEIKKKYGVPHVGDILITAIGTIGEIFVVDSYEKFYFKDGNVLWLKDFNTVNPYFLLYILMSFVESLRRMSHGSAYNALPIQKLKNHIIHLPSAEAQKQIVARLDSIFTQSKKFESIYQKKIYALAELKQSILQKAFSGKLTADSTN